jgi:hypothetical protein
MAAAQEPRPHGHGGASQDMDLDKPQDDGSQQPPVAPLDQERSSQPGGPQEAGTSGRPQQAGGSLEECLALLRGRSDEQRLVGLLLATKFVSSGDLTAVEAVFDAVGWAFIGRLFKTGGGGEGGALGPYATLALSLVSAFVRVPRLAAATEAIERVPLFLGVLRGGDAYSGDGGPVQDALECLLAIASASEEGLRVELESGGVAAVCQSLSRCVGEEERFLLAVRLLGTLLTGGYRAPGVLGKGELAVPVLARGFAFRTDMLVFECLGCLLGLLSDPGVQAAGLGDGVWKDHVRAGVGNLLKSRNVKAEHRLGALKLAHLMVEAGGGDWMLGARGAPEDGEKREEGVREAGKQGDFFLLLLNTVRVEVAVQLNEVARAMFPQEKGKQVGPKTMVTSAAEGAVSSCYALLEAGVNVLAEAASADTAAVKRARDEVSGSRLSADTAQKAFGAASEATAVVLDFLEQAKEHGRQSDDTVLASVRVLGRFLAEAPEAHREKVGPLLGFLLGVKASDRSAANSDTSLTGPNVGGVWYLLPALGEMTEDAGGCRMVIKAKAHKAVVDFVRDAIIKSSGQPSRREIISTVDMELEGAESATPSSTDGMIARALDVLLNVLDQQAAGGAKVHFSDVRSLLPALQTWTAASINDPLRLALSATVIANVLLTDEMGLGDSSLDLEGLLDLVVRFLDESFASQRRGGKVFDRELWELTLAAGAELLEKFPSFESRVRDASWMQEVRVMSGGRLSRGTIEQFSGHAALLNFLAAAAEKEQHGMVDA